MAAEDCGGIVIFAESPRYQLLGGWPTPRRVRSNRNLLTGIENLRGITHYETPTFTVTAETRIDGRPFLIESKHS